MDAQTLAVIGLVLQGANVLLIPAVVACVRVMWRFDRRLYAIELKLNMHQRSSDS